MSRPLVVWKYAASLDGRIAARDGSSKWITSEESRADVHRLRAELDAIMVGSGTLAADDPSLTVRHVQGRQPLRVVVDSNARTPADARVLDHAAPTLIAVAEDAYADHLGDRVVRLPRAERGLDLPALLKALEDRGIGSILLEGGPTLAGSFLAEGLVDRVVAYVAPVAIGGEASPPWKDLEPPRSATPAGSGWSRSLGSAQMCAWSLSPWPADHRYRPMIVACLTTSLPDPARRSAWWSTISHSSEQPPLVVLVWGVASEALRDIITGFLNEIRFE